MQALIIDTSTERGIVSFVKDHQLLYHVELPFGLQNSHFLLPELDKGLKELNLSLSTFNLIAVGVGPGSYTGIRVGAMAAKTLSMAENTPLIGISTLDGFETEGEYAVVIDAKMGGVYIKSSSKAEPAMLTIEEALEFVRYAPEILSPNSVSIKKKFDELGAINPKWIDLYPNPLAIYRRAVEKFHKKEYSTEGDLELLYMRKTQAEIEKERSSAKET